MTQIIEILEYKPEYLEATRKFLTQLTTRPIQLTEEAFRYTLASANSHLFFLLDDKAVAGMLTVGIYHSPTGGKAWIEVKSQGIPALMLTSNPKRTAANKLYQTMGFEQKETNVYRMNC